MFVPGWGRGQPNTPNRARSLKPAGLDGQPVELLFVNRSTQALADWMVAGENPFFAKSLANRYWKHFFGRGLVEPEDDMRVTNPPSNPELLDALSDAFVDSGSI